MSYIQEVLTELDRPEYEEDSLRIVHLALKHGIVLTLRQAEAVWQKYSDSMCAGWMYLPKDDDQLWNLIGE